jgi:hydrogenase expression/formation protein HypD
VKWVDDFRSRELADNITRALHAEVQPGRRYRMMEFCGGHTHAICRYGIMERLPKEVELIHGPGCPVCVLPIGRLEQSIRLAHEHGVTLCTFGDLMRVPAGERQSLMRAKAEGADIRMVFGSNDALKIARDNPGKQIVFLAIGFETTTPTTAAAVKRAQQLGLENFSVLCNHVLTPSAIQAILHTEATEPGAVRIDGFIGPGHVSTIVGTKPYERFSAEYGRPIAVSGFEPLDLLQSMLMVLRQLNDGRAEVENQYSRAVNRDGNLVAQQLVDEVMELRPSFEWRGLGTMAWSALKLRDEFSKFDAEVRFPTEYRVVPDHPACACGEILRGLKKPLDCKIFGTVCSPEHPLGACMVSPEGSCAAYYLYGRHREAERRTA